MAETSDTLHGPLRMWLTVFGDQGPTRTIEMAATRFTVGRDPTCDLALEDPKVSRHHAEIVPGVGPFRVLRDLGSANGTLVNGRLVTGRPGFAVTDEMTTDLAGGEWIQFGDTRVLLTLVDPRATPGGMPQSAPKGTEGPAEAEGEG
jgi:pSer/pThr/pTyr-binding forkhead associated (FHA) protein